MLILKTGKNQTIFDLALQHYGNMEAIGEILNNNPHLQTNYLAMQENNIPFSSVDICLSLPFIDGQVLYIDNDSQYFNKKNVSDLSVTKIASFDNEGFIVPVEGIRDLTLEYDFIIL
jgi:hypothetical protein